jgi:hypothetical protein
VRGPAASPDSMHQHPDHDSDHAQRPHDGEGDKATLKKIHPDTRCLQGPARQKRQLLFRVPSVAVFVSVFASIDLRATQRRSRPR